MHVGKQVRNVIKQGHKTEKSIEVLYTFNGHSETKMQDNC